MYSKKVGLTKSFTSSIKRFFRARNIIIISEHKVDHVPLSGIMQVLLLVGTIGLFSGVSYITGSYVTARHSIREKERKLASTAIEKVRIGEEMDALKHDLLRLSQNGKELSSYSKFIIDEHAGSQARGLGAAAPAPQVLGQNTETLADHISYLERRIKDIEDENEHLITAVRQRTDKKIDEFEDIISMTGLSSEKLERIATSDEGLPYSKVAANTPVQAAAPRTVAAFPATDTSLKKITPDHGEDEGGPFIPYDSTAFSDTDRDLIAGVDRMVLLHDIVEQLPLSQPVNDAHMTGPFGKRVDPINGRWAIHPGVDLVGPAGSKIYCTSAGKVIAAGHRPAYGNAVDIDHGFGIVTRYAHMSKLLVKEGDIVRKGQQIGVQGSTGRSTGAHLHYEVRINDQPVNPVKFLHAGEYVSEAK
jgi:murein DD-endopeptidase MepM/ murein hydrolase activator NlpD